MTAYLLNLADLALTLYALQHGGVELNPLMQNPAVMLAWKTVGVGVLCYLLHHFAQSGEMAARWGLRLCACAFALACINNLIFIIFGGA